MAATNVNAVFDAMIASKEPDTNYQNIETMTVFPNRNCAVI